MLSFMHSRNHNIWQAARDGNKKTISRLLPEATAEDLLYEARYFWKMPTLVVAAFNGHLDIVQMLLHSKKVDVNQKSSAYGWTALMHASIHRHLPVVEYLIQQGADMNMHGKYGETALIWASEYGHLPVVEYLVRQDATINTQNADGDTALLLACRKGKVDVVKVLLQAGADKSMQNKKGKTAFSVTKTEEIKKILVEYDQKDSTTLQSPTVNSAVDNALSVTVGAPSDDIKTDSVSLPLSTPVTDSLSRTEAAQITSNDIQGRNIALIRAAKNGEFSTVDSLLQTGADLHFQDDKGCNPLIYASFCGHITIVQLLINHGADIQKQNKMGNNALMLASYNGHSAVVEVLVQNGADINMYNHSGNTALMTSCEQGKVEVIKVLLQTGADKNIYNKKGETAMSVAKTEEIKKILVEYDQKSTKALPSPPVQKALSVTAGTPTELSAAVTTAGVKEGSTLSPDLLPTPLELSPTSPVPATKSDVAAATITADDRAALDSFLQSFPTSASLQRVMHTVAAHDRTLNLLVSKQKECPSLFWFYPKQPKLRNWLSNPAKCLFQDTLMMVVVCPVTLCTVQCGPDGVGWEVNLPKGWVKQWGPAILFSVYVLQAAALAGRVVGIPLPPAPSAKKVKEALGLTGMLNSGMKDLTDSLRAFAAVTKETLDQVPELQELCAGLQKGTDKALPAELPMHLVDEAYKSIHTFLTNGENAKLGKLEDQLRGRMERVMAPDGDIEWVSVEGRQAWLDKKKQLVNLALQQEESPVPALSCSGWVSRKLQDRHLDTDFILHCEEILLAKGFTTEDSFACLPPDALTVSYFESIGITELGKVGQLIALHRELNSQYCTPTTSATPSPIPAATEAATLTADEKASMLQMQKTVDTLISELKKLRASSAQAQQQQSPTGGPLRGGNGGLALQQAQCNVTNPRTRQPYTLDELVEEILRLQKELADCGDSVAKIQVATELCLEVNSITLPATADKTAKNERERVKSL